MEKRQVQSLFHCHFVSCSLHVNCYIFVYYFLYYNYIFPSWIISFIKISYKFCIFTATLVPGLQPRDGHMRGNVLQLADNVNCDPDENDREILSCLQDADANQILAKQLNPYGFGPNNDHLISTTPFFYTTAENSFYKGIFNKVPLLAGFNNDDGINRASKYINNASLLDNLNSNWSVYGAEQIFGKCCEFSDIEVDIANEIRYVF